MRTTTENEYFDWLCNIVCNHDDLRIRSYSNLLDLLHHTEFTWMIDLDENRSEDGICLRYRFASWSGYGDNEIFLYLPNQCSVLEMMAALAIRCEETIMSDPEIGDRTSQWFWSMIRSLGLMNMHDEHYEYHTANMIINQFLDRQYSPDGKGGLFTLRHCLDDLRTVEIWHQLLWYLGELDGL